MESKGSVISGVFSLLVCGPICRLMESVAKSHSDKHHQQVTGGGLLKWANHRIIFLKKKTLKYEGTTLAFGESGVCWDYD